MRNSSRGDVSQRGRRMLPREPREGGDTGIHYVWPPTEPLAHRT